jgi:hypothetical protein
VPFGAGQFQNGQAELGWTFLAGESLLVVGSAISDVVYIYNVNQKNDAIGSSTASVYEARAHDAALVTNLFTAGLALVAVVGIIHAQATFVPEHVQVRARPLPPVSLAPILLPLLGHGPTEGAAGRGGGQTVGALLGVGGWF